MGKSLIKSKSKGWPPPSVDPKKKAPAVAFTASQKGDAKKQGLKKANTKRRAVAVGKMMD